MLTKFGWCFGLVIRILVSKTRRCLRHRGWSLWCIKQREDFEKFDNLSENLTKKKNILSVWSCTRGVGLSIKTRGRKSQIREGNLQWCKVGINLSLFFNKIISFASLRELFLYRRFWLRVQPGWSPGPAPNPNQPGSVWLHRCCRVV